MMLVSPSYMIAPFGGLGEFLFVLLFSFIQRQGIGAIFLYTLTKIRLRMVDKKVKKKKMETSSYYVNRNEISFTVLRLVH